MAERLPVLFRDTTPEGAADQAKDWAHTEGLTLRTVASIRRRDDLPTWGADHDPYVTLWAFEVTLVVKVPAGPLPEPPTLPEAPSLSLWAVPA